MTTPDQFIPGGIKPTDFWHRGTTENTCSRCRFSIKDAEVPLMLWTENGEAMLIYCEACLKVASGGIGGIYPR